MPILPKYRHLYATPEWRAIRKRIIIEREKYRCQHCNEQQGQPYRNKRGKWCTVQLGVAHLDHDPYNMDESNLAALCRACHLKHDQREHVLASRYTRQARKDGARPLLGEARANV